MANISSYSESIWRRAVPPTAPVPPRKMWASRYRLLERADSMRREPRRSFLNPMCGRPPVPVLLSSPDVSVPPR